jgi:mRNA interferase MazF
MKNPSNIEVWIIDFSGSRGHEQKGERPGILWRDLDHVKMAVVIPCTTTQTTNKFPHTYLISPTPENGLSEDSVALLFQIASVDKKRLIKKIGKLDKEDANSIAEILREMLHL